MYIAMCGIFGPHRNIVVHWDAFQPVFNQLIAQEEDMGGKHLFQTTCQFFANVNPDMQKFAATLCKKFYDNELLDDQFFIEWHAKRLKLDRDCILFERKAESAIRPLLDEFIGWLNSADYDEEYDQEEESKGAEEEEEKKEATETDAQRQQRELIERQKQAQAEQLAKAKSAAAESKAKAAAQADEDAKRAEAEDAENLNKIEKTTKIADIAVDDGFDIDDI